MTAHEGLVSNQTSQTDLQPRHCFSAPGPVAGADEAMGVCLTGEL